MFAVLVTEKSARRGLWGRVLDLLLPPRVKATSQTLCGTQYKLVTAVESVKGGLNFARIVSVAGGYSTQFIFPQGVQKPEYMPIKLFEPAAFEREMLTGGAERLIAASTLPLYQKVAGLIDPGAEYQPLAERILKYASVLKIYTHNPRGYEPFVRRMMEELGAPVILCDRLAAFAECLLVLSPAPFECGEPPQFSCPVLGVGRQLFAGRVQLVEKLMPQLPQELLAELPEGISPHSMAGALYDFGKVTWLGKLLPHTAECSGRVLTLPEITEYMDRKGAQYHSGWR